jgi:preprotein translocase subunit SecA
MRSKLEVVPGAPYAERSDRQESAWDRACLSGWGRVAPLLSSGIACRRLGAFVKSVQSQEASVAILGQAGLREAAEDVRTQCAEKPGNREHTVRAFSLAREAARRYLGLRHFPTQILGGGVMMEGALAEMQTGEGKTLTAMLPAVAAALAGRPVHIVTVNDYLARRDAEKLGPAYGALGLSVGLIQQGQPMQDRQRAYACEITYCTNKELVFDYLRDRLTLGDRRSRVQLVLERLLEGSAPGRAKRLLLRGLHFAIVDEADSVLIDEARTPLVLSGPGAGHEQDRELFPSALDIARLLRRDEDFRILLQEKTIRLTEQGSHRGAALAAGHRGLWRVRRAREQMLCQALTALHLFRRDVQYIVADGKVQIVDEYTGRVMPDRSWEHGMHQLVEAKESCEITPRHQTLARITYQQFFRRYQHLCGMTGTAIEASGELRAVYRLRVVRISTNRPLQRTNRGAQMFGRADRKWAAVVDAATSVVRQGRAVLIGTRSVEASEHIGALLRRAGLTAVVLNARQDGQEAEIVAGAGQRGRVTVATNMAGRGTDILLHPAVQQAGGLHVILTEYHESGRIDRQLFGRCGRQGDPGSFEAIVALDDEIFTHFLGQGNCAIFAETLNHVPAFVGVLLRAYCQASAERLHRRTRRQALADGRRLEKALAFAGIE